MDRTALHRVLVAAAIAIIAVCGPAHADDSLVLQLKWLPQAQFAGYYVALDKGFYRQERLDLTIRPGGPDIAPARTLADKTADVAVNWLSAALVERQRGIPLVNIAQIFQRPGYEITCRRGSGVEQPADFKDKTLGTWFGGSEYPFLAWMAKLGLRTEGAHPDIRVLHQDAGVEPLIGGKAACLSTMRYNEYEQLIDAGLRPADLVVLSPERYGVDTLEDGLYVIQDRLGDAIFRDRLVRFVRASIAGWRYALMHRQEAVALVPHHAGERLDRQKQERMLSEIARLIPDPNRLGYLELAAYQHTVAVLLSGTVDPVITKEPRDAWAHEIWKDAVKR